MTVVYERLLTEDLNVGVDPASKTNPGGGTLTGTQIGIHSFAVGGMSVTATWSPGAVAVGSYVSTTVSVPGATIGDFVMASHDKILTNALGISAHVSADGVVTVVLMNLTAAAVTPASGTLKILVFKSR